MIEEGLLVPVDFRPAWSGDRPAVSALMRQLNQEDAGEEPHGGADGELTFRWHDDAPNLGGLFVAVDEERVVGYALMATYLSNEYGGLVVYLDEFYILPGYRNRGNGSRFLAYLENEYRNRGYRRMLLEVLDGNQRAARFYERQGFTRPARRTMSKPLQ